jgi:hypothetical protein
MAKNILEFICYVSGLWRVEAEIHFQTLYYGKYSQQQDMCRALKRLWALLMFQEKIYEKAPWFTWRLYAAIEQAQYQWQYVMTDELKALLAQTKADLVKFVCRYMYTEEQYFQQYWTEWADSLDVTRGKERKWIQDHHIDPNAPPRSVMARYISSN